jgi:uncharacterized protein (TIGR00297 family)
MSPLLAAALALFAAAGARATRSLTIGGALAAFLVGALVSAAGGWAAAAALFAFFVSSSAVSRLESGDVAARLDAKTGPRDAWQVLANGAAAAVGATAAALCGLEQGAVWISTCSLAAAGADTWGTSIGSRAGAPARHVLTGARVPRGQSGGITAAGTLGAVVGAAIPAAAGSLVAGDTALFAAAVMIGWVGMLADSVLGASVQGSFYCAACNMPTERRRHRCGARTNLAGGLRWLTNDGVNALATALAGAAGVAWLLFMQ